jgi:hypothetical protein
LTVQSPRNFFKSNDEILKHHEFLQKHLHLESVSQELHQ